MVSCLIKASNDTTSISGYSVSNPPNSPFKIKVYMLSKDIWEIGDSDLILQ